MSNRARFTEEGLPRLPDIIRSKGVSIPAFAKSIGTNYVTIYRWVVGIYSPNLRQLRKLAAALDCTITDIVGA